MLHGTVRGVPPASSDEKTQHTLVHISLVDG